MKTQPHTTWFGGLRGLLMMGACLLMASGCVRPQPSPTETLTKALRAYHGHLLFQRYDEAAGFVPATLRQDFLEYYEGREGFHITEYDMSRLELSADEHSAQALVVLSWYVLPSASIQTTRMQEKWTFDEPTGVWQVVEQKPLEETGKKSGAGSTGGVVDDPSPQ